MSTPVPHPQLPTNSGDAGDTGEVIEVEILNEIDGLDAEILDEIDDLDAQPPASCAGLPIETNLQPFLESSGLRDLVKEVAQEVLKEEVQAEEKERRAHLAERRDDVEIHVDFEANTWSSFYLFFVTLESGKGVYTVFEQFSIIGTIMATWLVQGLLIGVIWLNMTENPFNEQIVYQILRWRVLHGHSFSQVQTETGKPYMEVFCNEKTAPWSWESQEFETISRYLDGVVPGWTLTLLALIAWVSCCASEFRATVEQALATMELDRPHIGSTNKKKSLHLEEESMQVVSMSRRRKFLVLSLISVPRMVIMITLLYTGCVYLCNTASLEDLVLNAMALIFVIEFDELVYAVCVTARAQKIVASVAPMKFPVYQFPGGLVLKDVIRISLCLVAIALSCTELLFPFIDSVQAAKDALCGGDTALSYQANTPLSFIHVLQHDRDLAQCPSNSRDYQYYLKDMYNVSMSQESITSSTAMGPHALQNKRIKFLLEFVYRDSKKDALPNTLKTAMDIINAMPGSGSSAQPGTCSRFDAAMKMDTCQEEGGSNSQIACAWPYRSYLCEGWPAFAANRIKATACSTKPTTNFSCALWDSSGIQNPFTFCRDEKISGSFSVNYGRKTQEELSQLQAGFNIIDNAYIYVGVLGQFAGWNGVAGAVRQQGRRLQAKSVKAGGGVQVHLQLDSMFERRLTHEQSLEVRFTLSYEILIPFPNSGFIHSTRAIFDDLSGLASNTSKSRERLVEIFEQKFTEITSKTISKGCLLVVDNASVPIWTASDTDLEATSPGEDDSATCRKPNQCVDLHGWQLSNGINCGTFEAKGWCTNGGQGSTWDASVLNLSDVVVNGVSVVSACCACGGGTDSESNTTRQLNEAAPEILGEENKSSSEFLLHMPVGTPSTVSSAPASTHTVVASMAGVVAATGQSSDNSGATTGGWMMEPDQRVSKDSLDLKKLLTRLSALEQKNAALESELAGIRAELAVVKSAQQA